jgi:hypothetical protein
LQDHGILNHVLKVRFVQLAAQPQTVVVLLVQLELMLAMTKFSQLQIVYHAGQDTTA